MKLPRDVSAEKLINALKPLGYVVTRQKGSHMRITTNMHGQHHEVVPAHDPIKTGRCAEFCGMWRTITK